ncbi:3D domain-containing protein [Paenibacillus apis]|uniref:3D domain-containing protein n=1 Tax=Paenibacillus apis TaxID=1792174 RepID=UPI0026593602|nr:3D domain-containing protein [Paenibacillus apis]
MRKNRIWSRSFKTIILAAGLAGVLQGMPAYADSIHTAKDGDTFYLLAKQYNVSMDKLMEANPEVDAKNIYNGVKLTIPGAEEGLTAFSTSGTEGPDQLLTVQPTLKVFSSENVVEAWGKTLNYTKTIQVKASAYSAAASENGKWGAVDYFGNPLELGTIAVDPKVIPMGTKVLVTGHSHANLPKAAFIATASDQGGAIKGNRIDIFIPGSQQSVKQFGFQDITLYILE